MVAVAARGVEGRLTSVVDVASVIVIATNTSNTMANANVSTNANRIETEILAVEVEPGEQGV